MPHIEILLSLEERIVLLRFGTYMESSHRLLLEQKATHKPTPQRVTRSQEVNPLMAIPSKEIEEGLTNKTRNKSISKIFNQIFAYTSCLKNVANPN